MSGRIEVIVNPGICGMKTRFTVAERDGKLVISADTPCARIAELADALNGLDSVVIATAQLPLNPVMKEAGNVKLHPCCIVPSAIIKAAEICAGLALPGQASISFGEMSVLSC